MRAEGFEMFKCRHPRCGMQFPKEHALKMHESYHLRRGECSINSDGKMVDTGIELTVSKFTRDRQLQYAAAGNGSMPKPKRRRRVGQLTVKSPMEAVVETVGTGEGAALMKSALVLIAVANILAKNPADADQMLISIAAARR